MTLGNDGGPYRQQLVLDPATVGWVSLGPEASSGVIEVDSYSKQLRQKPNPLAQVHSTQQRCEAGVGANRVKQRLRFQIEGQFMFFN
jgi:hypothetical protein